MGKRYVNYSERRVLSSQASIKTAGEYQVVILTTPITATVSSHILEDRVYQPGSIVVSHKRLNKIYIQGEYSSQPPTEDDPTMVDMGFFDEPSAVGKMVDFARKNLGQAVHCRQRGPQSGYFYTLNY